MACFHAVTTGDEIFFRAFLTSHFEGYLTCAPKNCTNPHKRAPFETVHPEKRMKIRTESSIRTVCPENPSIIRTNINSRGIHPEKRRKIRTKPQQKVKFRKNQTVDTDYIFGLAYQIGIFERNLG